MISPGILPLAILIGLSGTWTYLNVRHRLRAAKDRAPWLLIVLAWFPLVCWILSQFVTQD